MHPKERQHRLQQKGATLWLTGLPAAGKSTVAYALERVLFDYGHVAIVLDPDDTASSFDREEDRLFASKDRTRRLAEFARRSTDAGLLTICTFSGPTADERDYARKMVGDDRFFEIHVATSEEDARAWDNRGTYERLDAGEFVDVTAGAIPYEKPARPILSIRPAQQTEDTIVTEIIETLRVRGILFEPRN